MTEKTNKEVDLLEVLVKVVQYLKKNLLFVILIPLAGALMGWFRGKDQGTSVQSSMMLMTNLLTEQQFNFLLRQYEGSSEKPFISPEHQAKLLSLGHEVVPAQIQRVSEDPRFAPLHTQLTINVSDTSALEPFQESIIKFLESSSAVAQRKKDLYELQSKMIEGIDHELQSLEQLKQGIGSKSSLLNPAEIYVQSINLLERKLFYQQHAGNGNISIVKGFSQMSTTVSPDRNRYVGSGFAAGILLLIVFLCIRFFAHYYYQYTHRT